MTGPISSNEELGGERAAAGQAQAATVGSVVAALTDRREARRAEKAAARTRIAAAITLTPDMPHPPTSAL